MSGDEAPDGACWYWPTCPEESRFACLDCEALVCQGCAAEHRCEDIGPERAHEFRRIVEEEAP